MNPTPPTPGRFLIAIEQLPREWRRAKARGVAIEHPRLGMRITLGVLACRLDRRDEAGNWHLVEAPFQTRARIAELASARIRELVLAPEPPLESA